MTETNLTAYCVRCKTMRPLADEQPVFLANGRAATRGRCPECGTTLTRIGSTDAHASLPKPEPSSTPKPARAPKLAGPGPAPSEVSAPLTQPVQAYCVKCKTMRPMADGRAIFMANARPAAEGRCPECGTRLFKIGVTPDHEGLPQPVALERADAKGAKSAKRKPSDRADAKVPKSTKREVSKTASPASASKQATAGKPARAGKSEAADGHAKGRSTGAGRRSHGGPLHGTKLVIVESPAKARTVGRFLGRDYDVRASVGHVRDLLRSQLSVDIEGGFVPRYRVPDDKKAVVKDLKAAAADAREVYLATDPDREGEAIAWHLLQAAEIPEERAHRVVFHEITRNAIAEAFRHSRDIDMELVDAQQARRILDRLVGYQISPLLWDRVKSRLSAGRVQSVALRLIVEREREIQAFVHVEYWSLDAELAQQTTRDQQPRPSFLARLVRIRGQEADLKNEQDSQAVVRDLEGAAYAVSNVKRGERRRRPNPPFTTSTLQQDASNRLGMAASRTMRVAQDLYEGIDIGEGGGPVGLITYMRTDSVNVAKEAQDEARQLILEQFGPEYVPSEPNVFKSRAKNAQEAHEAIRPTSVSRSPAALRDRLSAEQFRVYELIWRRFVASQMAAAIYDTLTVEVAAGQPGAAEKPYLFRASGSTIRFPGFLAVYAGGAAGPQENAAGEKDGGSDAEASNGRNGRNGSDQARGDGDGGEGQTDASADATQQQTNIPNLAVGELLDLLRLIPEQHFTQPPPRYTEASLVKALEEYGIGRPSTYAAIISTILERNYVERSEKKLIPTDLGFTVNDLLVKYFDSVFNVGFTAQMEESLDSISRGESEMTPVLRQFYDFFEPQLQNAERTMEKVSLEPEKTGELCPEDGGELVIKQGRYGRFVGCSNYPACRFTKPLVAKLGVLCPKDKGEIVERRTRQGRVFYGCANYPACDWTSWKRPVSQPCPQCGSLMVLAAKDTAECTVCGARVKL
jgi:DNA topoisomerase I